jgi:hypothetical protein
MTWFKGKDKNTKEQDKPVDRPVLWPNGWSVRTPQGIWYIYQGKRQRFFSERCFESWNLPVRNGTVESLSLVPVAEGVLGFRTGTLIRDYSNGKIYLISGSYKRHITSPDVIHILGKQGIIDVSKDEAGIHLDGEPINALE